MTLEVGALRSAVPVPAASASGTARGRPGRDKPGSRGQAAGSGQLNQRRSVSPVDRLGDRAQEQRNANAGKHECRPQGDGDGRAPCCLSGHYRQHFGRRPLSNAVAPSVVAGSLVAGLRRGDLRTRLRQERAMARLGRRMSERLDFGRLPAPATLPCLRTRRTSTDGLRGGTPQRVEQCREEQKMLSVGGGNSYKSRCGLPLMRSAVVPGTRCQAL